MVALSSNRISMKQTDRDLADYLEASMLLEHKLCHKTLNAPTLESAKYFSPLASTIRNPAGGGAFLTHRYWGTRTRPPGSFAHSSAFTAAADRETN
jgi:hypothetical protein